LLSYFSRSPTSSSHPALAHTHSTDFYFLLLFFPFKDLLFALILNYKWWNIFKMFNVFPFWSVAGNKNSSSRSRSFLMLPLLNKTQDIYCISYCWVMWRFFSLEKRRRDQDQRETERGEGVVSNGESSLVTYLRIFHLKKQKLTDIFVEQEALLSF
jgi:hypothetical protein